MRLRKRAVGAALAAASALAVACGGSSKSATSNANRAAPISVAPAAANTAATNTAENTNGRLGSSASLEGEDLRKAADLFAANCAACHLGSGTGVPDHKKDGIPDFTDASWHRSHPDAEVRDAIENGKGAVMPTFANKLDRAQIDLLVAYLRGFPSRPAPVGRSASPTMHDNHSPAAPATKTKPNSKAAAEHGDHSGH